MYFCKKCNNFSQSDRCDFCGAKKLRAAEDNDPVFLTKVKGFAYAGLLEGALKHNNIPYFNREKHGGVLKYVGLYVGAEEYSFYVPLGAYEKSKKILEEIFKESPPRLAKNPKIFKQVIRRKNIIK